MFPFAGGPLFLHQEIVTNGTTLVPSLQMRISCLNNDIFDVILSQRIVSFRTLELA